MVMYGMIMNLKHKKPVKVTRRKSTKKKGQKYTTATIQLFNIKVVVEI